MKWCIDVALFLSDRHEFDICGYLIRRSRADRCTALALVSRVHAGSCFCFFVPMEPSDCARPGAEKAGSAEDLAKPVCLCLYYPVLRALAKN